MLFRGCSEGVLGCRGEHWSPRDGERLPQMSADASTVFITYETPVVLNPVVLKLTLQRRTWEQRPCSHLVDAFLKAARPSILKAAAFSQGRAPRVEDVVDAQELVLTDDKGATITAETGGFNGTLKANLNAIIGQVSDRDLFSISSNNDVNARVVLVKLDLQNSSQFDITSLSGLNVTVRFDS